MRAPVRRLFALGTAATAACLIAASTAYACTVFAGRMTVTGVAPGAGGVSTVVGRGTGTHEYCGEPLNPQVTRGAFAVGLAGATINIKVDPASCAGTSYQLTPSSTYQVILNAADDYQFNLPFPFQGVLNTASYKPAAGKTCIPSANPTGPGIHALGTLAVNAAGSNASGPGGDNFTLPQIPFTNTPMFDSSVCVFKSASDPGIMAPIHIIL